MTRELTPEAEVERNQFERECGHYGCSCFISPPCGWCTHPGNPHNQEEDETAWCEVPGPTADELIEMNVAEAHRVMKEFISELTAKHLWEMRGRLPDGFYSCYRNHESESRVEHTVSGLSILVPLRRIQELEVLVSGHVFMTRFSDPQEVLNIEDCGIPGDWIVITWHLRDTPVISATVILRKVS